MPDQTTDPSPFSLGEAWQLIEAATKHEHDYWGHNGGTGSLNFRQTLAREIAVKLEEIRFGR